ELELELKNDEPTEPIYTTIQVGNIFSQLDKQLIANVKIENVNNPLNPPPPDIFKLIQPEINEIKDKRKEAQKVSIYIIEDKSTFIEYTLNNSQQQIIIQLLQTIVETYYKKDESFQEALLKRSFEIENVLLKQQDEALENIQEVQKSQKEYHDKNIKIDKLKINDKSLLLFLIL
ncbi:5528_t:CDS:2, partial [Dentiscutata erythropus]